MQIVPSGSWAGAASAQQSVADAKHSHSHAGNHAVQSGVDRLEHSEKASDRDARERYEGPQNHHSDAQSGEEDASHATDQDSMLQLPASDEAPPQELDLLG